MRVILAIWRFLTSVYFVLPVVTLILSVCVWFFSPFIGTDAFRPFDEPFGRWIFIAVLWGLCFITLLIVWLVRKFDEKAVETKIVESVAETPENEAVAEEMKELKDKLKLAIAKLRTKGRKSLYELPWYIIIGPPGSGKTTAIANSGLNFPLADEFGKEAIGGVGGTRNCDWWFTDEAVLIDTAGRYTTQESDAESDNLGWQGFLGMLKKHRIRQPINGAMVAISLSDLSMQDETTQKAHGRAIRRRLAELREKLGVRFPVYVLFTKADMIAGFAEFFDNLGKEEREQVWGFTLPIPKQKDQPLAAFDGEFAALLTRLNAQQLERMQTETDPQRRALIAGFPAQLASVRETAKTFLNEVFTENAYDKRQLWRGVYFTSGTQEGTPIDRLMMGMARTFGIGRQAIGSGRGTGRSYFLTRLFGEVLFPEAGLVSSDDKVERRYRAMKWGGVMATLLVSLAMGGLWARSYFGNVDLLASVEKSVADYQVALAQVPGNPIADIDPSITLPALNILRAMPVNPIPPTVDPAAASPYDPESRLEWGLYQGAGLANETGISYRDSLNTIFLPRLLLRLETLMQSSINAPETLYDTLKVYLMLGLQGPLNAEEIHAFMEADWSLMYPGSENAALRADLRFHLDALISQPMQDIGLNGPLVEQVQGILAQMPVATRVYNSIINSPEAISIPQWRLSDIGGPNLDKAFVRTSGKPMNEGIDGIFTYDGFNKVFKEQALSVSETIQKEGWVLGPKVKMDQSPQALNAITRDVLDLYYNDFIARYDGVLGDLDVIPMASIKQAVEVTNILSGPTSPIVNILNAVDKETTLTQDHSAVKVDTGVLQQEAGQTIGEDLIEDVFSIRQRQLISALNSAAEAAGQPPPKPPGSIVEERFAWLHDLVRREENQPSQLDNLIASLVQVYQDLNKIAFRGASADPNAGSDSLAALQQAAQQVQGPLARWASQITTGGAGITAEGTRAAINTAWVSNVLPFCTQVTGTTYPFVRSAAADTGMADFAKLFGTGGLIDAFMTDNLKDMIDTSTKPWKWKTVNGVDLGISPDVLAKLEAASEIKGAFFGTNPTPAVNFQITPVALDPNAQSVSLTIDDKTLEFAQDTGQPLPTAVTWPGSVGVAQIVFGPPLNGAESGIRKDGPWGWFRLLDGAEVRSTNAPDRRRIIFNVGGRIAIFEMQMSSVNNAFALPAMKAFSCPQSF
ncbi:type VI secretion system membrane subunit TssM [Rhodobacter sp. KR11]|uniref:type VI secretion system membrane subunit TssM n=1 Tax=Rhodobacter sp. KR11 TaxID=2974588 RepID=UPI0022238B1A|nr:type VI secretion system membrane subunit TssM [Rhodobacter sp. KR11]MCW1917925.1 type VI secretion system membrane subunit TssM [Rhodobacter sp. KR11]